MPRKALTQEESQKQQVKNEPSRTFKQIQTDWNNHIESLENYSTIHLKNDDVALKLQLEFANNHDTSKFCNVCKVIYSGRNQRNHDPKDWSLALIFSKKTNNSNEWYARQAYSAFKAIDESNAGNLKLFAIEPFLADNIRRCTDENIETDLKCIKKFQQTKSKVDIAERHCRMKNSIASSILQ